MTSAGSSRRAAGWNELVMHSGILADDDPDPDRAHDRLEHRQQGDSVAGARAAPMQKSVKPMPS